MLDTKPESVRFSREYAVLLLRYLHTYSGDASSPEITDDLDQATLNHRAHSLIKQCPDPAFGLDIGRRLHICDYGAVGYAAMNCSNLIDALTTTVRFRDLLCKGFKTELEKQSNGYLYSIRIDKGVSPYPALIEFEFAACIRFVELIMRCEHSSKSLIKQVQFEHAQTAASEQYFCSFRCEPRFLSGKNAILLDTQGLHKTTQNPNPTLFRILNKSLEEAISMEDPQVLFSDKVRAYLANYSGAFPTQEDVAQHFCLSVSGLKARLSREGNSYRDIAEGERYRFAEFHLRKGQKSIKQIGFELGFADQSSFNRAFKRWSGRCPNEFRLSTITGCQ